MIYNEAYAKLLAMDTERIKIDGELLFIIPEGKFSPSEIDELRKVEDFFKDCEGIPTFANFLPDDVRPKGIPKL